MSTYVNIRVKGFPRLVMLRPQCCGFSPVQTSILYGIAVEEVIPGLQRFPYEVLAQAASNFRLGRLVLLRKGMGNGGRKTGNFTLRESGNGVQ